MSPSQEPKKKLQYTRPTNVEKGTDESFRLSSPCDPLRRFINHPVGPRCAMRPTPIFCFLVLSVRAKLLGFHAGWRHCPDAFFDVGVVVLESGRPVRTLFKEDMVRKFLSIYLFSPLTGPYAALRLAAPHFFKTIRMPVMAWNLTFLPRSSS